MMHMARCAIFWSLSALATAALAQEPAIRILVGFPPGGGTDVVARLVADRLKDTLATAVLVENRPGAGGQLVAKQLKLASPDGKTLMATASAPITLAAFRKLDYDPSTDFSPLSLAATFQLALVAGAATPAASLQDYLAWMKMDAKRQSYGTAAAGSLPHLLGSLMARQVGVDLNHVAYNGGAPLLAALSGGHVPAGIVLFAEALPLHQSGKVRILASSGVARSSLEARVPTFVELGYPEMVAEGWIGFYAPAGTPRAVVNRLSAAIRGAVNSPAVRQRLVAAGFQPIGSTADDFSKRVLDDMGKWGPVGRSLGLTN
jgi:tripartite-type tricarboxylate transporter receptor subunit TctC